MPESSYAAPAYACPNTSVLPGVRTWKRRGPLWLLGWSRKKGLPSSFPVCHHCGVTENDTSSALSFWFVLWDPEGWLGFSLLPPFFLWSTEKALLRTTQMAMNSAWLWTSGKIWDVSTAGLGILYLMGIGYFNEVMCIFQHLEVWPLDGSMQGSSHYWDRTLMQPCELLNYPRNWDYFPEDTTQLQEDGS